VAIWEEMVGRDGNDIFALIELAKWCEHRRRDFTRALALSERACACEQRLLPDECTDLAHRRDRLARKLTSRKTAL
jgi:hypothetical protein